MNRKYFVITGIILIMVGTPLLADAAATYKAKCFACHGEKGKGDTVMGKKLGVRNLATPAVQGQADAALVKIVTDGKNKMPPYKGKLTGPEITALVAHIRTFAAK